MGPAALEFVPGAGETPASLAAGAFEPSPPARAWAWAFASPGGMRLHLARRGAEPVAYACALGVRTRVLGEPRTFAQLLPLGLSAGEAVTTLAPLLEAFVGVHGTSAGDLVHYAFPTPRDRECAAAQADFELLRVLCLFVRERGPLPRTLPAGVLELERFGPEADVLYACCATHWHASAVRDAAFLNWRFGEHPLWSYRRLAVQSGDTLRGYAVVRAASEFEPGLALVLDWLVLPGDDEAAERLLEGALAAASQAGASAVALSLPEWSPWAHFFQERGFRHRPTEVLELVRGSVPRFDMLWLRDNWWSTLADALLL